MALLSACPKSEGKEKDSTALLNEILGGLSVDEGDFSREWIAVFGETEDGTSLASSRLAETQQEDNSFFLPSQLLDQSLNILPSSTSGQREHNEESICVIAQLGFCKAEK